MTVYERDRIRVVIQNAGFSRGFGVYGGGLIDADIRRVDEQGRGGSQKLGGNDIFAEMFPSFFFQAVACDKVEVLSDGTKAYVTTDAASGTVSVINVATNAVIGSAISVGANPIGVAFTYEGLAVIATDKDLRLLDPVSGQGRTNVFLPANPQRDRSCRVEDHEPNHGDHRPDADEVGHVITAVDD